ncbi:MAG: LPS-assembly protein LptD [Xanthobacteraceae bacterium]
MADLTGTRQLRRRRQRYGAVFLLTFAAAVIGLGIDCLPAFSQVGAPNEMRFPTRPKPPNLPPAPANAPMLVQADELKYDYSNDTVAAVGNVQIYYGGSTIEADKVIYDQKTKRLRAEGNARLTEPDGKITYGQVINLTDDYRDGFVDSLRLEMPDDTRFAATRADRTKGNYTVMQNGVYTACEPCKDDPKKPPEWQVKAARIIHDEGEKMIYFEDGTIDFFGMPLAYFPFMSAPDPTVKRKSGFLFPMISTSSAYGVGIEVPYYFNLAPDYDLTLYPKYMTQQGLLMEGEWNQRLINGSYSIKAAGIFQQDPGYFASEYGAGAPETKNFRGTVLTAGQFNITDKWVWGWTGVLITDPTFITDYGLSRFNGTNLDPFHTGTSESSEGISQLYLAGRGERSYFDIRSIYYTGYSELDQQSQLPVIAPVLDYSNVLPQQVMGGELSYKVNLTSLSREQASYDPISRVAVDNSICANGVAETADSALLNKSNCLLRGIPGVYTRASAEMDWRRTVVTDNGQMITPFLQLRGDVASVDVDNQPGVSNYIATGQSELARVMPVAGVEYHYPFIDVEPWGTQTIEPIAQLVLRPNETEIGKFPNEDAQSLVFDDTNLFSVDKFSGWDRVEGGGRLNAGIEYTAQFNRAGSLDALFGQSYQLFGLNSFTVGDITNTGLDSGLDKSLSDYVARIAYQPNSTYMISARARFDEATFAVQRFELEARANFDRWGFNFLFGDYAAQPDLGFLTRREGFLAGTSFKITSNWVLLGSAGYDIYARQFNQSRIGIGYVDDCVLFAFNYVTGYAYNGTSSPVTNSTFLLQLSLRTLGGDVLAQGGAY